MGAAEQLSFGGMPQRLYACTPTRLTSWLDCPRRYRMTYLDRPPPPKGAPWAHNSVGASVHNALAAWWRLPLSGRSVTAAGDLLQAGWIAQGFADEQQSARQRARARAMVECYVATLDPGRRAARRGADGGYPYRPYRGLRAHRPAGRAAGAGG